MKQNAQELDKGLQQTPYYSYTHNWDSDLIHGCSCDVGYSGWSCSERVCPKGDDPLTMNQADEVQLIRCDLDPAAYTGKNLFTLSFRGAVTRPFGAAASAADIRSLLEDLPTIGGISVSFSRGVSFCNADFAPSFPASGNVVSVTFLSEHGDLPSLVVLNQRGSLLSDTIDNSVEVHVDGDTCTYSTATGSASVYSVTGTKESLPCSGRGACDPGSGACKCYPGFASSDGRGGAGSMGDCGYAQLPVTSCPGYPMECSGHGSCGGSPAYKCTCNDGFMGGDCSIRTCPKAPAWFDYPTAKDEAHSLAECSNKGECDRATGACKCQSMFEGAACERMTCPGSDSTWGVCSGHGRCLSMLDLAEQARVNGVPTPYMYGVDPNNAATWDAHQIHGCACDAGWSGYDCSLQTCPSGEDITLREADPTLHDEEQVLTCQLLSTANAPSFRLSFRGDTTAAISPSATAAEVKAALEELESIEVIDVEFTHPATLPNLRVCSAVSGTDIHFKFRTNHGDVPPIEVVMDEGARTAAGGFSAGDGWGDTDLLFTGGSPGDNTASHAYYKLGPAGYVGSGVKSMEDIKGTSVEAECSGRGTCNRGTGTCACYAGFGPSDGMRGPGAREDCGWREPFTLRRG